MTDPTLLDLARCAGKMIPFSAMTGTRSTLAKLAEYGWGVIITPDTWKGRKKAIDRWTGPLAVDNGAWGAHVRGEPANWEPFQELVARYCDRMRFGVLPDIVAGGLESLKLSDEWLANVPQGLWLLAVQDGMTPVDALPVAAKAGGIFVGGSTEWKWQSLPQWGRMAAAHGFYLHIGRVNSEIQISRCHAVGADSFDGSTMVRQPSRIRRLTVATRTPNLWSNDV